MHLNDGEIRTYQDGELRPADHRRVEAHLATCPLCQEKANLLAASSQRMAGRLAALQTSRANPLPLRPARHRLEQRIQTNHQEKQTMLNKLTTRISRPVMAGITLIAVLAVALAFPSVRALANDFLRLFRVEQVQVVPIDMSNMPGKLQSSANLEAIFSKNVQIDQKGEPQEVADAAAASAQAGISVRLPESLGQPARLIVQPGGHMSFTIDLELMRGVLKDLGQADIQLPDSLNGQNVSVSIPAGVAALYGDCPKFDETAKHRPDGPEGGMEQPRSMPNCTSFFQMPSPNVEAPQELDVAKLGQVYLQILGMSPDEAAQFASHVDWATTFVVPVPSNSTNQKDVTVDGVQGTLIRYRESAQMAYALLWVKDGIVYALTGPGDGQTALDTAATLK